MTVGDGSEDNSNLQLNLTSNDNQSFVVSLHILRHSKLINDLIRDLGIKDQGKPVDIPITNASGSILKKVIEWAEHHKDDPDSAVGEDDKRTDDIESWDLDFFTVDQETIFAIMLCANYLDIKPLLDTSCKTIAKMIMGKSPDEIRRTFNIKNDFAEGEEDKIRRENAWCDE